MPLKIVIGEVKYIKRAFRTKILSDKKWNKQNVQSTLYHYVIQYFVTSEASVVLGLATAQVLVCHCTNIQCTQNGWTVG